ncbi:hypothetical protein [Rothia sp. P4278]|uniref:hypothetical protein n=1 Tax=Rothia sp. P4278 TaxID=3402658 RepID=UPI003ADDA5C5
MSIATPNFGWPVPVKPDPATIPQDMLNLALPIDAVVQQLSDRVEARESIIVAHDGQGAWSLHNGLGEPVPVHDAGDGDWQVMA